MGVYLSKEEERMLEGEYGSGVQKAIKLLAETGDAMGAERMIKVASSHIVPPDVHIFPINPFGKWSRSLVQEYTEGAEHFAVPATINPKFLDFELAKELGLPELEVKEVMKRIEDAMNDYKRLGVIPTYSCVPYVVYPVRKGEHLGGAESSCVLFNNSICGAMNNRESGPTALATALTGRTPEYGMHLPENRYGDVLIELKDDLDARKFTYADYSTLGYYVGKIAMERSTIFAGLPEDMTIPQLKCLLATLATSGGVALTHVVGVTPEAPTLNTALGDRKPEEKIVVGSGDMDETYERLCTATNEKIDFVILGCPHLMIEEITEIAHLLKDNKIRDDVKLVVFTLEPIRRLAEKMGLIGIIENAGGSVITCVCSALWPVMIRESKIVATNSAKAAHYIYSSSSGKCKIWCGNTKNCVNAAIKGKWM